MTIHEFLKDKVPFLLGLTDDQALYLAKSAEQKPFRKGQNIILRGVSVDGLHVLAQGKVSVYAKTEKDKGMVKVAEFGPGEVFGETSIVEFCMAGATIRSESDDTMVFVIPEAVFRKILATDPDLEKRTMALIQERRQKATKPA
jgi:CRP-like cAMP-binding protein